MTTKDISKNAAIAAIYFALTLINPLGWGMFQFRFSEIISVIPFYNRKYIPGVLAGVVIANCFSPLGLIDVVVGFLCGAICYIISKRIKNNYINSLIFSLLCGTLVGFELKQVLALPFLLSFVSIIISTMGTSLLGIFIVEKTKFKEIIRA